VQVTIPPPSVTVSGRALSNGQPVVGGTVLFVRFLIPLETPFISVTTDSDGRYTAVLDRPGDYDVRLSSTSPMRLLSYERRSLTAGPNVVNLTAK
jgi:hypothetical protein